MLKQKAPLYVVILTTLFGSAGTYFITSAIDQKSAKPATEDFAVRCNYTSTRLPGYEFVSPLLFAEETCQSPELGQLRNDIETVINNYKSSGTISDASVYLRRLTKGQWMGIDETEKYFPGSLMKVPELITFMKMNEKMPGLLDKKINYTNPLTSSKNAHYVSKSIVPGNTYTVRELLYYMIAYSDNNATMVLNQMMDINIFKKTFTDLGMPEPDMNAKDIPIGPRQFSFFMRVIYNASYLGNKDSEYCAELLSHTDFKDGFTEPLPNNLKVAHKFGEAGDQFTAHFSESGIVYVQNAPYLLTVMTKGKDMKALPAVISKISGEIYNRLSGI